MEREREYYNDSWGLKILPACLLMKIVKNLVMTIQNSVKRYVPKLCETR